MKNKRKLTDRLIKSLKPEEKLYRIWDADLPGLFVKVRPSGRIVFGFWYRTIENKQAEFTIGQYGSLTLVQAKSMARQLAGKVAQGIDVQKEKKAGRSAAEHRKLQTLGHFIEHRLKDQILNDYKSGQFTLDTLNLHFSYLYDKPMQDITPLIILKWRQQRQKKGIGAKTLNRNIAALKGCLSKAVKWGVINDNPLKELKLLKIDDKEKQRFLSREEEQRLRLALDDRENKIKQSRLSGNKWRAERSYSELVVIGESEFADHIKPMILLLLNTGMRPKELFTLEWRNVDFQRKIISIVGSEAKSGKTRHIPLNTEAFSIIKKWKAQKPNERLAFPSPVHSDVAMQYIPKAVYRVLESAEIKNFRPYDLRHTFASNLVMAGVDLNTIRELLGHADIKTTLIYAHLAPEHKANAVELLNRTSAN